MKTSFFVIAASALIAAPLAAQETTNQAQPKAEAPAEAEAQPEAQASAEVGPATAADLVQGASVRGVDGTVIGTIEAADAQGATVVSGPARLRLPLNNFQKDGEGLRIGANREQFLEAAGAAGAAQPS